MFDGFERTRIVTGEATINAVHAGTGPPVLLLAMWGTPGVVGTGPDNPVAVWREHATDVHGVALDAGHFLVEERPEELPAALERFLEAE